MSDDDAQGANGASIGADLTRAGLDVTFIEQWPAHVEAMRKGGIPIEMPDETLVTPVRAFHLCEVATLREAFDIVLVVVKAYDTRWACELIKPLVKPDGLVVGVQNGMTMEDVASIVGPERTLGAVIEVTSNMFQPGIVVRQTPPSGSWFGIGAFDASTRGRENEVGQCLRHAGTVEITDDIRSAKWMKLVVNAAVDVGIGPAGDVWVTNNWQYHPAALGKVDEALSTLGGGQGVVVFFGMAKPVKTPLIGPPGQP